MSRRDGYLGLVLENLVYSLALAFASAVEEKDDKTAAVILVELRTLAFGTDKNVRRIVARALADHGVPFAVLEFALTEAAA